MVRARTDHGEQIRKLVFKVVHSSTLLGPVWMQLCRAHNKSEQYIPQDVTTHWNSTHNMLVVSLNYRAVYDKLTANKEYGLRAFELTKKEWSLGKQLKGSIEVRTLFCLL